jgi:cytochrome P450
VTATAEGPLEERVRWLLAGEPAMLADPFPTWNELRETHPVWRLDDAVVLSRHADVRELLGDYNDLYSRAATRHSQRYEAARRRFSDVGREAFDAVLDQEFQQLVRLDPPDHPRLKQQVQTPFSIRSLKVEMEGKIQARVTSGLDELAAQSGPVDYKRFAYTLPLTVLGDLLGIPLVDLDLIHSWAKRIAENKFNADSEEASIEAKTAYDCLLDYIENLLASQHSTGESTGLIATLIEAERTSSMTHDECKAMVALMIFAGHETTSNLLAIGMHSLLRQGDQWELLVTDPDLASSAVEELTRYVTPAHFLPYVAAKERELGGVHIEPGDTIIGVLAAANRDPSIFHDPDVLDIRRRESRMHVGFGMGRHSCLGVGLARMEAVTLFRQMAQRFPNAQLVEDAQVTWGGRSLRTPLELPLLLNH